MAKMKRKIIKGINPSHLLLVEGEADRGFLEQVYKKILTLVEMPVIQIARPKDLQANYESSLRDGKQNVLNLLEDLLPDFLDTSSTIKRIAVIVDADYQTPNNTNEGYQKTFEKISKILNDFSLDENNKDGLIFKNGSFSIGVWIMPNNNDDGMLEEFIKTCVKPKDPLFSHATNVVKNLPKRECGERRFIDLHLSKAEVATWLAWQNPPGHGFYATVKDDLLHTEHELFLELRNWLKQVFVA